MTGAIDTTQSVARNSTVETTLLLCANSAGSSCKTVGLGEQGSAVCTETARDIIFSIQTGETHGQVKNVAEILTGDIKRGFVGMGTKLADDAMNGSSSKTDIVFRPKNQKEVLDNLDMVEKLAEAMTQDYDNAVNGENVDVFKNHVVKASCLMGSSYAGKKLGEQAGWIGDQIGLGDKVAAAGVGLAKDVMETREKGEYKGHLAVINKFEKNENLMDAVIESGKKLVNDAFTEESSKRVIMKQEFSKGLPNRVESKQQNDKSDNNLLTYV